MVQDCIITLLLSFAITAISGKFVIPFLKKLKFGQSILEIGPKWHMNKQGTPTMGGMMFIIGIGAATLLGGMPLMREGDFRHVLVFAFSLVFGAIGFVDDYAKVVRKKNQGLTAIQKLLLQLVATAAFLSALRYLNDIEPQIFIPFTHVTLELPWLVYLFIMMFVIVGAVNAVNLTDGIDGLASCVTIPVAVFFGILAFLASIPGAGVFASALVGGLFGFLIYNFNPAKVFMGDTGSLFLGGAVSGLAMAFDMPLILIFVGIIYIAETLSVILQVGYFKLTHGKRLFKMAPLHHHFEMCGWSEKKLCLIFTLVTVIGCIIAYFGAVPKFM